MSTTKKILITGASTGFGFITAKTLATNGHTVFASMRDTETRNKDRKKELLQWATEAKVNLKVVDIDVTSDSSVENAVKEILGQTNGKIDVIINNAGVYGAGIQESFTIEDYKKIFDVNVFGSARINNAFLPALRKQGHGLIIQISSILGRLVIPFGGVYDATKFAAEALSENLAYELKPLGIDVAIVQPGPFATELLGKVYVPGNTAVAEQYGRSTELMQQFFGQFTQSMTDPAMPNKVEDVAAAILQLINTPQGKRPLRTIVDKMMFTPANTINKNNSTVQVGLLENLGFGSLVINN